MKQGRETYEWRRPNGGLRLPRDIVYCPSNVFMPSMIRIAGRVNVSLIARITWTGLRVLPIEGGQAMASF